MSSHPPSCVTGLLYGSSEIGTCSWEGCSKFKRAKSQRELCLPSSSTLTTLLSGRNHHPLKSLNSLESASSLKFGRLAIRPSEHEDFVGNNSLTAFTIFIQITELASPSFLQSRFTQDALSQQTINWQEMSKVLFNNCFPCLISILCICVLSSLSFFFSKSDQAGLWSSYFVLQKP